MDHADPESRSETERGPVPWHALGPSEALSRLRSRVEGLSSGEVSARLAEHGPNVIERAIRDGTLTLLWRQINSPLIWVLVTSALLAVGLGKLTDGLVVLAVVVLNTIIGFVQEARAGRAIEALRSMVPERATVRRSGQTYAVAAAELVPGDVVLLVSGDKVPADMRLLAAKNLRVEEAALTGESIPAEKDVAAVAPDTAVGDRTCMVFGGTLVTYGTATAVVTAIANDTEIGRISGMLGETTDLQTPLTRALATVGVTISVAIVFVAFVLFVVGTWRLLGHGLPLGAVLADTTLFAIALAVGAIPEGLPAIVTIALAIGVQRMAARRAIIRRLPAAETLGSTTVICSDKTGTLTRNEMTVLEVWTPSGPCRVSGVGYEPAGHFSRGDRDLGEPPDDVRRLLLDAALCSDATLRRDGASWSISGDPTEAALVVAAEKAGLRVDAERRRFPRRDAIPFESEHQFMATLHTTPEGTSRLILKGAPEVVLRRCAAAQRSAAEIGAELERLASESMRVLALADKDWSHPHHDLSPADTESGFRFAGLIGMIDPPRPEAIAAVEACRRAGITVKMITGDHQSTAQAIGRQFGLLREEHAVSGAELSRMDDEALRAVARSTNVFARVAPEHKLRLVRALQADNHVVAMTGDGVNDAPALKQANIGVAMGIAGTAVAKEAADIVLTDDNFATIAAAIEEGRRVYDNLIKSLAFVLPTNLGLALILIVAVLWFPFDPASGELVLPMLPTQLLWINLVATVALALPLAFEAPEPDVMRRPPRPPDAPILSSFVILRTVLVAAAMTAGAVGLFLWEYGKELAAGTAATVALAEAQTMAVTTVIMFQIFYMLNCRSLSDSIFSIGLTSNPTVFVGVSGVLLLQTAFVYLPLLNDIFGTNALRPYDLGTAVAVGAVGLPVISVEKWLRTRRAPRPPARGSRP